MGSRGPALGTCFPSCGQRWYLPTVCCHAALSTKHTHGGLFPGHMNHCGLLGEIRRVWSGCKGPERWLQIRCGPLPKPLRDGAASTSPSWGGGGQHKGPHGRPGRSGPCNAEICMWSESHSRPAPSWPPALTPKREIFTWTCYGHTSLMTKRCENPANSQQPTQSPLHSGFSRTHLYREKERGRAVSSVRLILSETFCPNLRSSMDGEEKSSFPTEQKGPILPP